MQQGAPKLENKSGVISLERRADIFSNAPLPPFNTLGNQAFAAQMRGDPGTDCYAIVCAARIPARVESVSTMRVVDSASVIKLRDSGVVSWPALNANFFALVYERPLAPLYWQSLTESHAPMHEDAVNNQFVKPLVNALLEFQRTGMVHGSIRSTNVYWREGGSSPPQLGECLSCPPGMEQPVLFETIERGLCPPLGRGPGQHLDDCYALGVVFALTIFGFNPLQNMDDQAILNAKIEQGSFSAFVGNRRLSSSHIELLRGLLADDAKQRWSASDIEQWLTGRRLTPKSSDAGRRASRHISFAGKEYWHARQLAAAMAQNVAEAAKVIEDKTLEKWLMRSYGDEEKVENINDAVEHLRESGKSSHYEDHLVARTCIALDPAAPIRYRGLSLLPASIPLMLVDAVTSSSGNAQILSEIVTGQLPTLWVNLQKDIKTDLVPLAQQLERVRGALEKTSFGNGLERALYELNPALPCLSPLLAGRYVTTARRVLTELENVAKSDGKSAEPMDRHLAAFIIVRDKRSEALFQSMTPSEAALRKGLALLTLFSEMQYRYGPDQAPGMTAWLYPLIESTISRFLSKPFQDKIRKQAKEAVQQGDLSKLLRLVDDPERIDHDERDFVTARRMYHDITAEIAQIEAELQNKEGIALKVGRPVAATLASVIAILLMAITFLRAMLQSLG